MFSFYLSNNEEKAGSLILGGYDLKQFAQAGKTDKDIFWADMAHKKTFFWTVRMGDLTFAENQKFKSDSHHMILDSGLSYALIPSADFKALTEMLSKNYNVNCKGDSSKDKFSAQVASSSCECKDYNSLPSLKM